VPDVAGPLASPVPVPEAAGPLASPAGPPPVLPVPTTVAAPDATWSEDFIPQRLPKRSRRNSKLQTPWTRQQRGESAAPAPLAPPVTPVAAPASYVEPAPVPVEPAPATPPPFAPNPSGGLPEVDPAPPAGAPGAVRFGPELPSRGAHDDATPNGSAIPRDAEASDDVAAEGSEERFAFFAAFRAAAERAREEAGIDTRRVPR
jgi:hypothetical protein